MKYMKNEKYVKLYFKHLTFYRYEYKDMVHKQQNDVNQTS